VPSHLTKIRPTRSWINPLKLPAKELARALDRDG